MQLQMKHIISVGNEKFPFSLEPNKKKKLWLCFIVNILLLNVLFMHYISPNTYIGQIFSFRLLLIRSVPFTGDICFKDLKWNK